MDDLDNPNEPLIQRMRKIIRFAVRVLAVIMTAVIIWGVVDVGWVLYRKLMTPPFLMLTISDILATFGAFMAVLIAIEIFVNICIYLREDVIHVQIVMATALMAIARKIIILDFTQITSDYVWAIAGVVFAMSIGYFLVLNTPFTQKHRFGQLLTPGAEKQKQGQPADPERSPPA
ncbi:MAG: phosphate-starvation-inducible PsiE family protein [Desulfobacter sp.]